MTHFYVYIVRGAVQNAKHEITLSQNSTKLEFVDLLRLEETLNNFSPIPLFYSWFIIFQVEYLLRLETSLLHFQSQLLLKWLSLPWLYNFQCGTIHHHSSLLQFLLLLSFCDKWGRYSEKNNADFSPESCSINMDPKISKPVFARQRENTDFPEAAILWLLHAYYPVSSGMCLKKKSHRALRGNCVRVPMNPLDHKGTTIDKINFPHTSDLWPLFYETYVTTRPAQHFITVQQFITFNT